jgi:prepilin-type N-terminal cleavage/methylation domain-containing protein
LSRRGFTLTEVLVGMAVFALLGMTLTRILINDSRFVSRQDALMSARQGARAAMNTVVQELQMISDGGLIWDSAKAVQARIPIAFGVACRTAGNVTTATLMPTDSLAYASALASGAPIGVAYLSSATYQFPTSNSVAISSSTNTAQCTADSIRILGGTPPAKLVSIQSAPPLPMPSGAIIYLYQTVTYSFANSTDPTLAGRKALFRQVGALTPDELVAPFDTAAGFRCLTGVTLARTACPVAAGVSSVRGLELRLISASERPPQGASRPQTFDLSTRIVFNNCPTPSAGTRCW